MHRSILPIVLVCTLTLLVFTPTLVSAQFTPDGVDTLIIIDSDGSVTVQGDTRMTLVTEDPGLRYVWTYDHPFDAVLEFRFDPRTFDVDRPKQVVPLLEDPEDPYPLFEFLPSPEVWDTDVPARVYNHTSQGTTTILRIQIPAVDGPEQTLILERDTHPPGFTLGEVESLNHYGFIQETTTTEFALGELQRRTAGSNEDWVGLPTTAYSTTQRFPVVGLDPETQYDVRILFTDWAGNTNVSATYQIMTPPHGTGDQPSFEVVSPEPDARLAPGEPVEIAARIQAQHSEIDPDSVRLYINLQEIHSGSVFEEGVLTYRIAEPTLGLHVVMIEATTTAGDTGHVRWQFTVGDIENAPLPVFALVLGVIALLAIWRRPPPS